MANIRTSGKKATTRPSRAEAENQISQNNKGYYTAFERATSGTTVLCDYFPINKKRTSYSESTKNVKKAEDAIWWDIISGFVMTERDSEDLEDKTSEERRISINLSPKTSFIRSGTIKPQEMDHIILADQGDIAKPYMVTKVTPRKYKDREIWQVDYAESTLFADRSELMDRVVNKKIYIDQNTDGSISLVVDADKYETATSASIILNELTDKFVEIFYDKHFDQVVFAPFVHEGPSPWNHFNYYANELMQEKLEILTYGYDRNTLFFTNIYKHKGVSPQANFNNSFYAIIADRDVETKDCFKPIGDEFRVQSAGAIELLKAMEIRKNIFADYRRYDGTYESKYVYGKKLYLKTTRNHMTLTRYYNSGINTVDMLDIAGYDDPHLKQSWIWFEFESTYIIKILDFYLEENWEGLLNSLSMFKRYTPDPKNIDDYLGIPLILMCIRDAIQSLSQINNASDYT